MINTYKKLKPLEERKHESNRLLQKYKVKIPLIVLIDNKISAAKTYYKFLVSGDISMSDLQCIIRRKIKINHSEAIFCLTENNSLLQGSIFVYDVYRKYKDIDGMLYIFITAENTFG